MFGHKNPGKLPSDDISTEPSSVVSSMLDVPSLSRRALLAAVACGACAASMGCASHPDASGSASARDAAEELAGAVAVASLPAGDVMWERVVCRSRSAHAAMRDETDDS